MRLFIKAGRNPICRISTALSPASFASSRKKGLLMHILRLVCGVSIAFASTAGPTFAGDCPLACKKAVAVKTVSFAHKKDIVDTAAEAEDFTTLVAAVKAAGLVETLKGDGPFTVFAPTNAAFGKLPEGTVDTLLKPENKEKLVSVLTYHVVPGKVMAADVIKLKNAKTVQGSEVDIVVTDGKVKIDNANVVKTDIECGNGVIHVIDAVILP
jgi:uncharacterized surface protein with fasciclin (FAS1) repeats